MPPGRVTEQADAAPVGLPRRFGSPTTFLSFSWLRREPNGTAPEKFSESSSATLPTLVTRSVDAWIRPPSRKSGPRQTGGVVEDQNHQLAAKKVSQRYLTLQLHHDGSV